MKKDPDDSPRLPLPVETGSNPIVPSAKAATQEASAVVPKDPLNAFVESSVPLEIHADNEFFLPIHGFVFFTKEELAVVNHPAFQRLGEVNQLGQAHLVYRGGSHKRLEHALGTVHVAEEMIQAVATNHNRLSRKRGGLSGSKLCPAFCDEERAFIRLAALLHDIGHLPAGHTLEDELKLLPRHDELKRLTLVLDKTDWPGGKTVSLRSVIDQGYSRFLNGAKRSASEVLLQIIAKDPPTTPDGPPQVRITVCRDVVGNTICADLLDYLHRDWYHLGRQKYFEKRLFQYMEIREDARGHPQFVISLGKKPRIKTDAVSAILDLLESRYQLAESVLFHRSKCAAASMLERSIQEIRESIGGRKEQDGWVAQLENRLLDYSDIGLVKHLLGLAEEKKCISAILPLTCLRNRRLYKDVYTTFHSDPSITQKLTGTYVTPHDAAHARLNGIRLLEKNFDLPAGSVTMYCPPQEMGAKIAEVHLHLDGTIQSFKAWDEKEETLAGGHLAAQLRRFARLWRVHVFLNRDSWEKMELPLRDLLRRSIMEMMLGIQESPVEDPLYGLALLAASTPGSPFYGKSVVQRELAARRAPADFYPSGAPSLSTYFKADNEV